MQFSSRPSNNIIQKRYVTRKLPWLFLPSLLIAADPIDRASLNEPYGSLRSAHTCINAETQQAEWGSSLELTLLAWQAREEGLELAIKNNPRLTPSSSLLANVNGRVLDSSFEWAPACKATFIVDFPNAWDLTNRWTYFYSKSTDTDHAEVNATTSSGFFPIWVLPQSGHASLDLFGTAKSTWQLHLNTADIELGYNAYVAKKLSIRLHCGIKGISVSQRFTALYSDGINDGTVTLLPSKAHLKNRCLGLGPRVGMNSQWRLTKGWSLLGDCAAAFALSSFSIRRYDSDAAINNSGSPVYSDQSTFHENFYAYRPNLEALLGIGWENCYGKRQQYSISFKAAYEIQYFWDQNMMRRLAARQISFQSLSLRGDLQCHGLDIMFGFGF